MENFPPDRAAPFRWNLAHAEQLGRLTDQAEPCGWEEEYQHELERCSARVIAFAGNSRVVFVGRSPESIFDYMSGLLADTSWNARLSLFHFSMRYTDAQRTRRDHPQALSAMREHMRELGFHPRALVSAQLPVTLADLTASGETFRNLTFLLYSWCREEGADWHQAGRRIRLLGITRRTKTSPNTWRWQQNAPWLRLLPCRSRAVKNVSLDSGLWCYFGNDQKKLPSSYHPARWGSPAAARPKHDRNTLAALSLALSLYRLGRTSESRRAFARLLAAQPAMKEPWCRQLVLELKNRGRTRKGSPCAGPVSRR